MFNFLHAGHLDLSRLNFGEIVLLPKTKEAESIQQYRPICLLNVSFKIFMKVATHRINSVTDHVEENVVVFYLKKAKTKLNFLVDIIVVQFSSNIIRNLNIKFCPFTSVKTANFNFWNIIGDALMLQTVN